MVAAARYPGPMNFALPIPTGQVIAYIRKPEEFRLNEYCQYVKSDSPNGTWFEIDRDQPVRVVTTAEFAWGDGDKRPEGNTNLSNFQAKEFRCERFDYPFTVGEETQDLHKRHGEWDIVSYEAMQCACQGMTARVLDFWTVADTSGNYTLTDTATNVGGGRWDAGTSTAPYLQKGLQEIYRQIRLQTNGRAQLKDLRLILNPIDAIKIRASAEITDYMKSSVYSYPAITGELIKNANHAYGLPPELYGVPTIVEDSPYVSTRPVSGPTTVGGGTRAHIKAAAAAAVLYRPGGMDAPIGTKSWSTMQMFYYKYEMTVEGYHDAWNKRHHGGVVDWRVFKMAAPTTGFYVTSITT